MNRSGFFTANFYFVNGERNFKDFLGPKLYSAIYFKPCSFNHQGDMFCRINFSGPLMENISLPTGWPFCIETKILFYHFCKRL